MTKLVTSYPGPDLDGTACMIAYREFLEKRGENVEARVFGEPEDEARLLLEKLDIEIPEAKNLENKDIILVDASFPDGISDLIDHSR